MVREYRPGMPQDRFSGRPLAGSSDTRRGRRNHDSRAHRGPAGGAGRGLHRHQSRSDDRGGRGAGETRGGWRGLLCLRLPRGRRRTGRRVALAGCAAGRGRHHAHPRAELLRLPECARRRGAVARPGWPGQGRARCRDHHAVLQHRDQPDHAAARPAACLYGHRRQSGADGFSRDRRRTAGRRAGHRARPAYRGDRRSYRLRGARRGGAGARQAGRRPEGRRIAPGACPDGLAHSLACWRRGRRPRPRSSRRRW